MTKQEAQELYMLVNTKDMMKALESYASLRQEQLKDKLTTAQTIEEVKYIQGAIMELGRIFTLRDEVNLKGKLNG